MSTSPRPPHAAHALTGLVGWQLGRSTRAPCLTGVHMYVQMARSSSSTQHPRPREAIRVQSGRQLAIRAPAQHTQPVHRNIATSLLRSTSHHALAPSSAWLQRLCTTAGKGCLCRFSKCHTCAIHRATRPACHAIDPTRSPRSDAVRCAVRCPCRALAYDARGRARPLTLSRSAHPLPLNTSAR